MFLQYAKYILIAVAIYTYGITAFATYQMFGFNGLALGFFSTIVFVAFLLSIGWHSGKNFYEKISK